MSNPRPITSVAISSLVEPFRKSSRMERRFSWGRPPWRASTCTPSSQSLVLSSSAKFFWFTKMIIFESSRAIAALMCWSNICRFTTSCFSHGFLSSGKSTTITCCVMPSLASKTSASSSPPRAPPFPTRIVTGISLHNVRAKDWTSFGHVAEKKTVWRSGRTAALISSMSPRKPMSSIRSASSKHQYVTLFSDTFPAWQKSISRPGVATAMCEPSKVNFCNCSYFLPPP
mmetsp:Transcript_79049/g.226629  ORF Transcript_79049/g.226629 Transcript_79049/m.226629 type:complete len:229 (-) Transcript_79049:597-1283(-)